MRKRNIYMFLISILWLFIMIGVSSYAWISRTWTPSITEDQISLSTTGALVISLVSDEEYNSNSAKYNTIDLNTLLGDESFVDNFSFKQVSTVDGKIFHTVDFSPLLTGKSPVFTNENVKERYIDVTFYLQIQESEDQSLQYNKYIFIHPDSEISDVTPGSNASKAIRIALTFNDNDQYKYILCNAASATSTKSTTAALTDANGKTLYKVDNNGAIQYDNGKPIYNSDAVSTQVAKDLYYYNGGRTNKENVGYDFDINSDLMLIQVGSGSTTKVNLKIWLEGGDEYCVEDIAGQAIKLVLKFDSMDVPK